MKSKAGDINIMYIFGDWCQNLLPSILNLPNAPFQIPPNHGEMVDGIQSNSSPLTLSNQCANISRLSAAEFRGKKLSKWSPYIKISCSNFISRFSRDFGGINPLSKYTNTTSTNSLNFETKANNQPYGKNAVLSVGCFARLNLTDNIGNIGFLTNPIFWIVVAVWETEWRGCDCWLCQNSFF